MRTSLLASLVLVPFLASPLRAQCGDWQPAHVLASGEYVDEMLVFDDGSGPALYAGGFFGSIDGVSCANIARWNGTSWSNVGTGFDADVTALGVFDDGNGPQLYAGGWFTHAGGVAAAGLARWDGTSWSEVGGGIGGTTANRVQALCVFDDGSGPALFVGGRFSSAGGLACNNVARWNGTSWDAVGNGVWGVLSWQPEVKAHASYDDGSGPALYVGGIFKRAGAGVNTNKIARWDGTSWSDVGGSINQYDYAVYSLCTWDDGSGEKLIVAGDFTGVGGPLGPQNVQYVGSWDGLAWNPVGDGVLDRAYDVRVLDDGRGPALFVAGPFLTVGVQGPNPQSIRELARWDGTHWSAVEPRLGPDPAQSGGYLYALGAYQAPGAAHTDLVVAGLFALPGASTGSALARYRLCDGPGESFCAGDGTQAAPCPCANAGLAGRGCQNSATTGGALLSASGTLAPDTLSLTCQGTLPTALAIFLQGDVVLGAVPFGDGLRCAGGSLKRLFAHAASGGVVIAPAPGDPSVSLRSAQLGDVLAPGSQRVYQVYYRDPDPLFCAAPAGNTWNVSNALRLGW